MQIEKFILSRNDEFMEGWPDLIKTASGKMICVYNECVGHGNRDHTHITLRESVDDGETWSEKRYIDIETFHGDQWNSIRLNQISDGRLILVCDRIADHERTDKTEIWMWESTDDGQTWSEGIRHGIYGYCADKIRELRDGTLLLLVSSYNSRMGHSVVYAHRSEDCGKTWSDRIQVAADMRYNLIEPAVLETSDGTLVAFMRENTHLNYDCMRAISKDGGKTWEGVYPIPMPGCHRPAVGYLHNGEILLTHRIYKDRINRVIAAAFFTEETAVSTKYEEDSVKVIPLDYDASETPDQGYTAWVQLDNGIIYLVNYITDDAPRPYIRGYRIRLE